MIRASLSATAFTGTTPEDFLDLATGSGARGIEWSDAVFPGSDEDGSATRAMFATLRSGLCTVSFASDYGIGTDDIEAFAAVVEAARRMASPVIRLRATRPASSALVDDDFFADAARYFGDEAGKVGISLCFEVHPGSVLASPDMATRLTRVADHPFVKLAWPASIGQTFDQAMDALMGASGLVGMLLVSPAAIGNPDDPENAEQWTQYLDVFEEQCGSPDMGHPVVLVPESGDGPGLLATAMEALGAWGDTLRRYHRRRAY